MRVVAIVDWSPVSAGSPLRSSTATYDDHLHSRPVDRDNASARCLHASAKAAPSLLLPLPLPLLSLLLEVCSEWRASCSRMSALAAQRKRVLASMKFTSLISSR